MSKKAAKRTASPQAQKPAGFAANPKLNVVMVEVSKLNPAPYNPRRMTEKQAADLTASITKFGLQDPIIVNEHPTRVNVVVGGHQRLSVCKLLGYAKVPCVYVNLAEPEERELNLRLNRNTGEWDWDALAEFDLPVLRDVGFTDEELAAHFDLDGGETPTDADVLPENVPARSSVGDVWLLGDHRLVCGDSTKAETVALALDGAKADCLWTDPPYNVSLGIKSSREARARHRRTDGAVIENDDMPDSEYLAFLTSALRAALTNVRDGGPAYVAHASLQTAPTMAAFRDAGGRVAQVLVWNKSSFALGRQDYHWKHEPVLYGWKDGAAHRWFGGRDKSSVFDVDKPHASEEHPTMKPVDLVRQMVVNSTMPGETVLDVFGGSGSTLIACEVSGRRAALVELSTAFCDVIVARWEKLTGKTARLEPARQPA